MHVGVVVNPIAGAGGRVALKGTDGKARTARERGGTPRSPRRAERALAALSDRLPDATVVTWGAPMGASLAREAGFEPMVVGGPDGDTTTATDTERAVRALRTADVDVLLFVGGDGTAADVAAAMDDDRSTPVLGVPAGVKVYSATFAVSPEATADAVAGFDRVERRAVLDVDEDAYRGGTIEPTCQAMLPVPVTDAVQPSKGQTGGSSQGIAAGVIADIDPETTYAFGPGSTVGAITTELGTAGTPLGVDVFRDGELLVRDGDEQAILDALGDRNVAVVSPIGQQGYVVGRGSPQLSPAVLQQASLAVVATRAKLADLDTLRVDTDNPGLNEQLRGWQRVRVGRS
jgi:predicted polyphosphate/ATP-dependent NAD kinase